MRADAVLRTRSAARCACVAFAAAVVCANAVGQTLHAKARESGCTDAPRVVEGSMYKCSTASGASAYFNVPDAGERAPARKAGGGGSGVVIGPPAAREPTPAGFPRVDPGTQKGRDDMRRKVLQDELAAEEKLLLDARGQYNNGAPPPMAEEQSQPQRYADRIARLRQAVQLHERNVEALRRELGLPR
ncbi:MAG TPA: hypothetical protein VFX05_02270 [Casimicrobiaceae bacterium]|nr:hypothetical protein [Casimicrobiaceae bacterium]